MNVLNIFFSGTPLFLTSDRVAIIQYISMTTPTRSKFVFRQPKLSYITNVFTLPFEDDVWASTLALMLIVGFALLVVIKWEWYKKKFLETKVNKTQPESFLKISSFQHQIYFFTMLFYSFFLSGCRERSQKTFIPNP